MISDEQLNEYRMAGIKVRVVRDAIRDNDVRGTVVAWNEDTVVIRRPNRKVVKLPRDYVYQRADEERPIGPI